MDFNNRLYTLRKQKGMSQEELANRLNVSRQTISKWEVGDSTPDMERLVALSDLFGISLDELVLGKGQVSEIRVTKTADTLDVLNQKVLTEDNKKKMKRGVKIAAVIIGVILVIDVVSMIIYFLLWGVPQ